MAEIKHQNIVKLLGVSPSPERIIVTQLIRGETLDDYVANRPKPDSSLVQLVRCNPNILCNMN